ncbi:MAG: hypothetical protein H0U86_12220 [Chloroflexi bacterium]|nr:hypothetical protein [Chloroflexota bacterium]
MRIYDGSPRQDWEGVLRGIGAFADRERLKEILFLELDEGFVLQGLTMQAAASDSDNLGTLVKRTYELTEDQVGELMDASDSKRGTASVDRAQPDLLNYYEQSLRILGAYIDGQKAHDVFFLEQEGSYVLRLFGVAGERGGGHQLSEFTRDEMFAMIEAAPDQRRQPAPETTGAK